MSPFYKKIFFYFFIIVAVLISLIAFPDDLIQWPINLPKRLSATLGEIRGLRFHQGIDIKTRGRVGYPVFAALPGKLSRLISKDRGYGNALFIDHNDGISSVYGHLDSFDDEKYGLNTLKETLKILYNKDNISFTLYTSNLLYRRGERIGYSGESGSGPPHLHFEVRDGDTFFNPLEFIAINDKKPPVIENLYLCVEKHNSTIREEKIHVRKSWGRYRLTKDPIEIRVNNLERIFLKLACYDMVEAQNRVAIYMIRLFDNGEMIFEMSFDKLKKNDFKYGHLIYDKSRSTINGGVSYAYFLCSRYGNNFSCIKNINDGYINLDIKQSNIRIEVIDFAGNISTLKFHLRRDIIEEEVPGNYMDIKKGKGYTIFNDNGDVKVTIGPQSISHDMLLQLKHPIQPRLIKKIARSVSLNRDDILNVILISPFDNIYEKPIKLVFRRPPQIPKSWVKNILVYQFFNENRLKPLLTVYDTEMDVFEASSITNGFFALVMDKIPPEIFLPPTHEFCEDKDFYRKIRLYTSENLSKIDVDSIKCIIDGELFPFYFDRDRKWIEVVLPRDVVSEGVHHILVKCSDLSDNQTVFRNLLMF